MTKALILATLSMFVGCAPTHAQQEPARRERYRLLAKSEKHPNGVENFVWIHQGTDLNEEERIGSIGAGESFDLIETTRVNGALLMKVQVPGTKSRVGWIKYKEGRFDPEPFAAAPEVIRAATEAVQAARSLQSPGLCDTRVLHRFANGVAGDEDDAALVRELNKVVGLSIDGKRVSNPDEVYRLVQAGKKGVELEREKKYIKRDDKVVKTPICCAGLHSPEENHCAHCLSHFFGFNWGATCNDAPPSKGEVRDRKADQACIRVNEIFAFSKRRGLFKDRPRENEGPFLIYAAGTGIEVRPDAATPGTMDDLNAMRQPPMGTGSLKHIGVYYKGTVWHYSNTADMWVKAPISDFERHYDNKGGTRLFWSSFPNRTVNRDPK